MTVTIGRRELLVALGGAAAAWPLAASAQQPAMPVSGYLDASLPGSSAPPVAVFRRGRYGSAFAQGCHPSTCLRLNLFDETGADNGNA